MTAKETVGTRAIAADVDEATDFKIAPEPKNKSTALERRVPMKIAIPVDEKRPESSVCLSFGRAPYFLFYDTTTSETYYLDNSAIENPSGAGIRAAQIIVDHGAKALLTPRCGENAQEVLLRSEVLMYQSIPGTVKENIDAFEAGELTLLSDLDSGAGRDGR